MTAKSHEPYELPETEKVDDICLNAPNIVELMNARAAAHSQKKACVFLRDGEEEEGCLTYGELDSRAKSFAVALLEVVPPGSRALLVFPSGLDFIVAFFGCLYAGVIAIPVNSSGAHSFAERIETVTKDAGEAAILTNSSTKPKILRKLRRSNSFFETDIVVSDDFAAHPSGNWRMPPIDRDTTAYLQYTSGSTRKPKGTMISHGNLISQLMAIKNRMRMHRGTDCVTWLPYYHDLGLVGTILLPLFVGSRTIWMPASAFLQKPIRWLRAISKYRASRVGAPTFAYEWCYLKGVPGPEDDLDLSCLQSAAIGAEKVQPAVLENFFAAFSRFGFRRESFQQGYGMAESTLLAFMNLIDDPPAVLEVDREKLNRNRVALATGSKQGDTISLVSCGPLMDGFEASIVDPDTRRCCPPDRIGEIWLKGSSVASGYWNRPDETVETFRARLADTGDGPFLRTGDMGFMHEGELFFTGRIKELVIVRGKNHYPTDIEYTVKKTDLAFETVSAAFSVEKGGTERLVVLQEIKRNHLKRIDFPTAAFKVRRAISKEHGLELDTIFFMKPGRIPITSSGKVKRNYSRQLFLRGELEPVSKWSCQEAKEISADKGETGESGRGFEEIREWLVGSVAARLKIPAAKVDLKAPLSELGLDSLAIASLSGSLMAWLGRGLRMELFQEYPCIDELSRYLAGREFAREAEQENSFSSYCDFMRRIPQLDCTVTRQQGRRLGIDGREVLDFASCNYLGLDHDTEVKEAVSRMVGEWGVHPSWTRAVGSPEPYVRLEEELSSLLQAPATLVFPNVMLLNAGVLPLLAGPGGAIIADREAHQTIHEACKLACYQGTAYATFEHDDLEDLKNRLEQLRERSPLVVAVDGVYSMSAKFFDLPSFTALTRQYDALLYIDDAHGFGVAGENPNGKIPYGKKGNGIVRYYGMDYTKDKIVYVSGLSKSYSSYAAFVTCFDEEQKARFKTAPPYVFSGPVPTASLASALAGFRVNERKGDAIRTRLYELTRELVTHARNLGFEVLNNKYFPIAFVVIGGMEETVEACEIAWRQGILITPGIFPAVPLDRGGLRFSVTAANTEAEIEAAVDALVRIRDELRIAG